MKLNKFAYLYSKPLGNHTLKIMKKIPGNLLLKPGKIMEISWNFVSPKKWEPWICQVKYIWFWPFTGFPPIFLLPFESNTTHCHRRNFQIYCRADRKDLQDNVWSVRQDCLTFKMSVTELGQILEKLKVTFKVKESLDFILLWKKAAMVVIY